VARGDSKAARALFLAGDAARPARTYSITSSARASSLSGIVRPSDLAVLTLITNSNLVDCSTGRSAGLAPLRTFAA
jgi:hypothetical protein